jgi:hypothetical protein
MRPLYTHRQTGWGILCALPVICGVQIWLHLHYVVASSALPAPVGVVSAVIWVAMIVTVILFWSLEISVTEDALMWRFGIGLIHRSVPISAIVSTEVTRTGPTWGIHCTRRGTLYNVSGFDAVLVRRKEGRNFLLGSNEARMLNSAIERAIAQHSK